MFHTSAIFIVLDKIVQFLKFFILELAISKDILILYTKY